MHRFVGGADANMYETTSITSPGRPTLFDQKRIPKPFEVKEMNKIDDIPGTKAHNKWNNFATKPQFDAARDLPESVPKKASQSRNVPDRQLMVNDIDGAQYSTGGGMESTNRCLDPLQPEYNLPSFTVPMNMFHAPSIAEARDVLAVDDIPGTRPNVGRRTGGRPTRDPLKTTDIDGARADYNGFNQVRDRFEIALNKSRNFGGTASPVGMTHEDYTPVTFPSPPKFADRTTRRSNVVQPVYEINGITIEDDKHTKPRRNPAYVNGGTFSLSTQDIPGATSTNSPYKKERREVRNIMNTSDVPGAQADTVVHSMVSERLTCPLFPVYKSLDDGSPVPHPVAPLLASDQVTAPSIRLLQKREEELKQSLKASPLNSPIVTGRLSQSSSHQSPLNSNPVSARGGFFSPVRADVRTDSTESADSPFTNVPRLRLAVSSGPNTARSGGARSTGRVSAAELSRRSDIDDVRNLPQ